MSAKQLSEKDLLDLHFDLRARDFLHTSFPAEITRVHNRAKVDVLPLVSTRRSDGTEVAYGEIFDVRMQTYAASSGSVFVSLPFKVGDKVWVFVSERDTFDLMTRGKQSAITKETHSLSDCFCIPAYFTDKELPNYSSEDLVIGNQNTKITVKADTVIIDTNTYVVNSPKVTVNSSNIELNGYVGVNGDLVVSGGVFNDGVNIGKTHKHLNVKAGTDVSGFVQPSGGQPSPPDTGGSGDTGGGTDPVDPIDPIDPIDPTPTLQAPQITQQPPATLTTYSGQTVTYTITATSNIPSTISYLWQNNHTGNWEDAATTQEYVFTTNPSMDGRLVRCIVTNSAGNTISNTSVLEVSNNFIVKPTIVAPTVNQTGVSLPFTPTSSAYSGTGTHTQSQWQVSLNNTFSSIIYDSTNTDLVSHVIVDPDIKEGLQYHVRVRYYNDLSATSDWSNSVRFNTEGLNDYDKLKQLISNNLMYSDSPAKLTRI
jgi:hypothetical protein